MDKDVWSSLTAPATRGHVNAKRIDAHARWDFFWGVDHSHTLLFFLQHAAAHSAPEKLPRLRGIQLSHESLGAEAVLLFRLEEQQHRDIFEQLCRDIVRRCEAAASEQDAIATAIRTTWRWHHLLRGGQDERLTLQQQRGLAGELLTLELIFRLGVDPEHAVEGWVGPLDAPKDFLLGAVAIEAKTTTTGSSRSVTISSENQLDPSGFDSLYLNVVELSRSDAQTPEAFTIIDLCRRVRSRIENAASGALDHFESLLAAAGVDLTDDYGEWSWIMTGEILFEVRAGFPRIIPPLPNGIAQVRYCLTLSDCQDFLTTTTALRESLHPGVADADRA